jgi:hypothetical protein
MPMVYFSIYRRNVLETVCPIAAALTAAWVAVQALIVLLQNRYAVTFVLPKILRSVAMFDSRVAVPEGEDAMQSPCDHFFHESA